MLAFIIQQLAGSFSHTDNIKFKSRPSFCSSTLEEPPLSLDDWLVYHNLAGTHQGKMLRENRMEPLEDGKIL